MAFTIFGWTFGTPTPEPVEYPVKTGETTFLDEKTNTLVVCESFVGEDGKTYTTQTEVAG